MSEEIFEELSNVNSLFEEQGNTKDVKKKFWKAIGKIKRMGPSEIDERTLDLASSLREKLYPRKLILSATGGFVFTLLGFITTFLLFVWVVITINFEFVITAAIIFLVTFANLYFSFLLGRCLGITFSGIKIDGFYRYSPMEFGVRMNYKAYLKAPQKKRVVLFGTTIVFEITTLLIETGFIALFSDIKYTIVPLGVLFIWLAGSYIIHKKARTGELHRFLRELKIQKEIRVKK